MRIFSRKRDSGLLPKERSWEEEFNCCVMGFHTYRKKSARRRFGSVTFRPSQGHALDMHDVFFGMSDSLLLYKKIVDDKINMRAAQDYVKRNMYRSLAQSSLGYICYDLASRVHDEFGSSCGFYTKSEGLYRTTERLMRFIALSFANVLSGAQRRAVLGSLDVMLREEDTGEFLELLGVIDYLVLYLYPDREDSQFMGVVERIAKSLMGSFYGSKTEIQSEKEDIAILALEAAFLKNAASDAYSHIARRTEEVDQDLKAQCMECLKRAAASEKELYAVAGMILDDSVQKNGGYYHRGFEESSVFSKSSHCNDYASYCTLEGAVEGMESVLCQAKELTESCEVLFTDLKKGKAISESVSSGSSHDSGFSNVSSASSRSSLSSGRVSLKSGAGSRKARDAYAVLRGSVDEHQLTSSWVKEVDIEGCALPYNRRLCVGVVASLAKKYLDDISQRESNRIPGDIEINSTKAAYTMFERAVASSSNDYVDDCMSGGYGIVLGTILVNLSCGDVSRVTGRDRSAREINFRLLALYVHMLCNLPPAGMKSALHDLRVSFEKYGKEFPEDIYDVLCMLVDVKRASFKLGYTEYEESSVRSSDNESYEVKVTGLLAIIMGYYFFCHGKEDIGTRGGGNKWIVQCAK